MKTLKEKQTEMNEVIALEDKIKLKRKDIDTLEEQLKQLKLTIEGPFYIPSCKFRGMVDIGVFGDWNFEKEQIVDLKFCGDFVDIYRSRYDGIGITKSDFQSLKEVNT